MKSSAAAPSSDFYSHLLSMAATPCSSLLKVMSSASARIASGAFAIATPNPATFIISRSFSLSPQAIVWSMGILRCSQSRASPFPLEVPERVNSKLLYPPHRYEICGYRFKMSMDLLRSEQLPSGPSGKFNVNF